MGSIKPISVTVRAVRLDGVVTTPPVVATAARLTYDVTIAHDDATLTEVDRIVPTGNRPQGNILVAAVPFIFDSNQVGDRANLPVPEHRNAVPCPP